MKNVFVMMATLAAAMSTAFRENKMRDAGVPIPYGDIRGRFAGKRNPAGSKFFLRAYKAKYGQKASSLEEAREWYADYLRDLDAAARSREAQKRQARAERNRVELKLAA